MRTQALLLGDSGYGIAPWLHTPYGNPQHPEEPTLNGILTKERAIIKQCFGQVKKRFPILRGQVRIRLNRVLRLIVACFILHNVAKYLGDEDDEFMDADDEAEKDMTMERKGMMHASVNLDRKGEGLFMVFSMNS
jgi:hypothetical protein